MTTITEHGIVLGANDKSDIPIFDGEDATKVAPFKLALAAYLNSKGVSLPNSIDDPLWMATRQILYASMDQSYLKARCRSSDAHRQRLDAGYGHGRWGSILNFERETAVRKGPAR